jgi:hypothetical protein
MNLGDLCEIKTNFLNADFWIKPNLKNGISSVTKTFKKEYIGVKVVRTDLLLPDYLYYVMSYYNQIGIFKELVNSDNEISEYLVKKIFLTP